jgi:hypothetical protein
MLRRSALPKKKVIVGSKGKGMTVPKSRAVSESKTKAASKAKGITKSKPRKSLEIKKPKAKRVRKTSLDLLLDAAGPNPEPEQRVRDRRVYEGKYKVDKLSVTPRMKNMGKST